jgi:hypothetical protein
LLSLLTSEYANVHLSHFPGDPGYVPFPLSLINITMQNNDNLWNKMQMQQQLTLRCADVLWLGFVMKYCVITKGMALM